MEKTRISGRRRAYIGLMRAFMYIAAALTGALVLFLIVYVLGKGLPHISWELLSTKTSYLTGKIGILPDILSTLYIVLAALVIVLPLGVGAAVYLNEYARNKRVVAVIEYAAETLSGIPSIIYGLVGMLCFCEVLGLQTSLIAGALTLVIMNLPTVMRTTQESLKTVPQSYREGAFGATLTVALYFYAKEQGEFDVAFAIAAVLMLLTLCINLAAALVERHFRRKRSL